MRFRSYISILFLLALFLTACQGVTQPATKTIPTMPPPPKPDAGKTTIVGQVVSEVTGEPIAKTDVRLADVVRQGDQGAFVLDGAFSPGDVTDENGYFAVSNVDAKEYVIVVGDVYGSYEVIPDSSGKPRVWKPTENQVMDIGELKVNLSK